MPTHVCSQCRYSCEKSEFSSNQWRKGDGLGRCIDCVEGAQCDLPTCPQCRREFRTEHELTQRMKVHRSRDVACPVCGDRLFASGANAVAHVESGFCTGCRGKDNARAAIHGFVAHNAPHLRNKMIGYDGNYSGPAICMHILQKGGRKPFVYDESRRRCPSKCAFHTTDWMTLI